MVVVVIDFAFVTMLPNASMSACKWTCTRTNRLCMCSETPQCLRTTNGGKVTHTVRTLQMSTIVSMAFKTGSVLYRRNVINVKGMRRSAYTCTCTYMVYTDMCMYSVYTYIHYSTYMLYFTCVPNDHWYSLCCDWNQGRPVVCENASFQGVLITGSQSVSLCVWIRYTQCISTRNYVYGMIVEVLAKVVQSASTACTQPDW